MKTKTTQVGLGITLSLLGVVVALSMGGGMGGAGEALASASGPGIRVATTPHEPEAPSCDPNWAVVSVPVTNSAVLRDVAVVSSDDVWSVGGLSTSTLTMRWDGSSWGEVNSANAGARGNFLNGVAAVAANDVWAVGSYQADVDTPTQTLVEHWDGTSWIVVSSPNVSTYDNYLRGVAAVAANDIWAVGYYTTESGSRTLIEHWNGVTWSVVPSPNPTGNYAYLRGIEAVSANDIWAVGEYYNGSTNLALILHWDGAGWSIAVSPSAGAENRLLGVDAVSANDVWAVGTADTGTLTLHWDGIGWSVVPSPNVGNLGSYLYDVAAVSPNDVWAVGDYDIDNLHEGTLVEHWNGSTWSVVSSPNPGDNYNLLYGIAAVSADDMWAVGLYTNISGAFSGPMALRYNPCQSSPTPTQPLPTQTPGGSTATPQATPTTCLVLFSDVPPGSTFYDFVRCLACREIISGYADGTYRPGNPVTRGQLSKIVSNSAGFSEDHTVQSFEDVPVGSTFHLFIERLAGRAFISGYPCGGAGEPCVPPGNRPYFRPNANVTRGQTAKIVASAAGLPAPPPGQWTFQDVPQDSTFWTWIESLSSAGAISGYPCGGAGEPCMPPENRYYFRPGNDVTRGQSAKIVSNTFFPGCQVAGSVRK